MVYATENSVVLKHLGNMNIVFSFYIHTTTEHADTDQQFRIDSRVPYMNIWIGCEDYSLIEHAFGIDSSAN